MHRSTDSQPPSAQQDLRPLLGYLAVLAGRDPGGLLETRARSARGMRRRFFAATRLPDAAASLLGDARHTDVYVGCVPRRRRAGDRQALGRGWVLWVDCDDPDAVDALGDFEPRPSIIVRSGTAANAHAYWPLLRPVDVDELAAANRRLAYALGADPKSAEPARILRPPGTQNFKHDPPCPVSVDRFKPARRYPLIAVVGHLDDPPDPAPRPPQRHPSSPRRGRDPLLTIAPAVYVEALTGLRVGRDRKVSCPFHHDGTPSLHVYPEPERGWSCFGCGRGGSIFDLAAELDGLTLRGHDFVVLRQRLQQRFGLSPTTGTAP
jgi:hypothetical protein